MAEQKSEQAKASDDEPTYHVDRLLEESSAFTGYPRHVLAGAFADASLGGKKNLTIDEAKRAAEKYLKRAEVKGE